MTKARKTLLPSITVTTTTDALDPDGTPVEVRSKAACETYYVKPDPKLFDDDLLRRARPAGKFNLFPVVLMRDGSPWPEANIWLMWRLEDAVDPDMVTYANAALDMAHYCEFLEDNPNIDWMVFPEHRLKRPTYRYYAHLKTAIATGALSLTRAKRCRGTVAAFYTWLKKEKLLTPEHEPWKEGEALVAVSTGAGQSMLKKVKTSDQTFNIPKQVDPYAQTIEDGETLRPLTKEEQGWLYEALEALGNYEMELIHLVGLLTGARIQTILTLQVRHFLRDAAEVGDGFEVRIPVGFGTGIDTKGNKRYVLHFPTWFYEKLQVYALSEAARARRRKAVGGDHAEQYLFLSERGAPLYKSKADKNVYVSDNKRRYEINGQAVRQFKKDYILPFIQKAHPGFKYRFHDTRASFGLNATDEKLKEVARGEISLLQAREYVKTRMGHSSSAVTDRYLNYRMNYKLARGANAGYDEHLRKLVEQSRSTAG